MVAMPSGLETASREELLALIGVLQDQNTLLRSQVAELKADNQALRADNARLRADNERLTNRVAELERRLGRNSANSSLPPSSDRFEKPGKKPAAKSTRKRGRQKGAEGFGLSMVADPDQTPSIMCPPAAPGAAKAWTLIPLLGTSAARSVISPDESDGDRAPHPHLRNQDRRRCPRAPGRFPFLLWAASAHPGRVPDGVSAHPRGAHRRPHR